MPPRNTLRQPVKLQANEILVKTMAVLNSVEGISSDPKNETEIVLEAFRNTWSRSARRKKALTMDVDQSSSIEDVKTLKCRLLCSDGCLEFNWMKGRDRGLFESFVSHVSRKVM